MEKKYKSCLALGPGGSSVGLAGHILAVTSPPRLRARQTAGPTGQKRKEKKRTPGKTDGTSGLLLPSKGGPYLVCIVHKSIRTEYSPL